MSLKILQLSDSMTDAQFLSFCRSHKGYICCNSPGNFIMQKTQHIVAGRRTYWKPCLGELAFYISLSPGIDNMPAIRAKLIAAFPEHADEIASWKL